MNAKYIIISGALFGAGAVAIGAFGAHALKDYLIQTQRTDTFDTAVKYHMYHALALLALGLLVMQKTHLFFLISALCFSIGIILFSGSLYVLIMSQLRWMGAITPFGGLCFILGWLFLVVGVSKTF